MIIALACKRIDKEGRNSMYFLINFSDEKYPWLGIDCQDKIYKFRSLIRQMIN